MLSLDMFIAVCVGVVTAVLLVPPLRLIAPHVGLVDQPGGRKLHSGSIPMVGGLAIFIAYAATLLLTDHFERWGLGGFLVWLAIVVLGLWNDIRHIPVVVRVLVQVMAIVALCAYTEIQLRSLGDLLGRGPQGLGHYALPLTILGLIGVKNGINLIDGLDGLAATQVLSALFWFALLCLQAGRADLVATILPLAGAVLGFLAYNLRLGGRPASVFLGDHGSVFLGFTLGWIAVLGSQGSQAAFTPMQAVWVLGVPILDTIRVMLSRMVRGANPFVSGRDHLHYLLVDAGWSVNATVGLLLLMAMSCGAIVYCARLFGLPDVLLLCAFLVASLVFFLCGQYLDLRLIRSRRPGQGLRLWR